MFQYVTVKMPFVQPPASEEQVWTDRLNAVAREGWRLVSLNDRPYGKGYTATFATFEREIES